MTHIFKPGDIVERDPDVTSSQIVACIREALPWDEFLDLLPLILREGPWMIKEVKESRYQPGLQHLRLCGVNLSKTQISSTSLRPSDLAFYSSSLRFRKAKPEWKQTELF